MKTITKLTAMERGYYTHKIMELTINKRLGLDSTKNIKFEYSKIKDVIDEDIIKQGTDAANQVFDIYEQYVSRYGEDNTIIKTEEWLHWKGEGEKGIADVYVVAGKFVHVIDLKTGSTFDWSEPSDVQFLGYAASLVASYANAEIVRIDVIDGSDKKEGIYSRAGIQKWEESNYQKILARTTENMEDPLAYELLLLMEEIKKRGIINKDLLDVVHSMETYKKNMFDEAGRRVNEEGVEYEGYFYDHGKTPFIDIEKLMDYAGQKGKTEEEMLKVMKPQKGLLKEVFTAEQLDEMENLGIVGQRDSKAKSLKKDK